ncbi:APC family permease [Picrophilus oshimae]|uniref:Amino acid/polyamine/organocation transporter, APC superfamily n=1 Tax=Picrophilus torridus (strain ATCC 700027 / DSM 9790 / JCM 10055 / NBRC 100828 / KAW 2/3) TaxID=1122961 RepID=A0A8G2L6W3_PICTO|nr:APC family permease [Picrophilus oshimae]SMD30340.1 amino acid/polyamine/organocation transporter, APC superfamily [Picrophilus oshimae DSM 9789]
MDIANKEKIDGLYKLKRGEVSTWGAIAEEIAAMAPACDSIAFVVSSAAFALILTPLAFIVATLTMFLEVNTLYHLSKRHASAGGYYGYIANAYGPVPAVTAGLMYPMYQIVSTAAIPVFVAGVFLPGVVKYFTGYAMPAWIWIPFILIVIIVPIVIAIVGIRPQMKYIKYASFFELIFLVVLSAIEIIRAPDNTLNVFNPFAWPQFNLMFNEHGGVFAGLGLGMVFGLTSFIGYGGSAPLGEEVNHPRAITRSLSVGLLMVGLVLTEVAYAQIVGWGTSVPLIKSFLNQSIPGVIVAVIYTGVIGGVMFTLIAFNSAFSDAVAMQANAGRVYFAMGRDGILPEFFGRINKKYATPSNALWFVAIMSSIISIAVTFIIGMASNVSINDLIFDRATNPAVVQTLENSFDFLTTMALGGLIITHILLNTSVMTLFRRLKERHTSITDFVVHGISHYVFPIIATIIFAFVLYESVVPPVFPITEALIVIALYTSFSIYYALRMKYKKPELMARAGKSVNLVDEEH